MSNIQEAVMPYQPPGHHCEVMGSRIAYHDIGTGEPVLLVHGIITNSFIWRRIIPLLSDRYRVIAVDLLGCGASDMPLDVPYSLPHHAEILTNLIDQLGLERLHLVGHDVGGGISQVMAVSDPRKFIDVSLVNPVAYNFWPVQPIIAIRTPIVRQLVMASLDLGSLRLLIRRAVFHKERLTPEFISLFWEQMKTAAGRKAFIHFANSLDNKHLLDISEALTRLSMPVLILRGDADLYLSTEISEKLNANIPNSRLTRIDTAGHFIQEDEPEWLSAELISFFESTSHGQ